MRIALLGRISVSNSFAFAALIVLWLALLPNGAAQSIGSPPSTSQPNLVQTPSSLITDTRWLALIRSTRPQSMGQQATLVAPTINIQLTGNVVAGRVPVASSVVVSVTRAGSPILSAQATPFPDDGAFMYVAYLTWYGVGSSGGGGGYYYTLQPGDVIWVRQASTLISMTVPVLSALADANIDSVYGAAPISGAVTTYLYPFATPDQLFTQTVNADSTGQYRAAYSPTLDMRPRDSGYVAYAAAPDRVAYVRFAAPFLRAQVNGLEISGVAAPRSSIFITVTQADGTPRLYWSAWSNLNGAFEAYASGNYASSLRPGEHVVASSAGQVFSMTVMSITARADLVTGHITGGTLANQPIDILRFNGPLSSGSIMLDTAIPLEHMAITSATTGLYTATVALKRPNYGVSIVTSSEGYQTYAAWVVPYLAVRMGSLDYLHYQLTGQIDEPFAPITITIQGPSGYYKDVRHVTAYRTGYFYDGASSFLALDTGDIVTVTTPHGVQAAMTLPVLTGQIDPATDIVSGTAMPNTPLTLMLYNFFSPVPPTPTPGPLRATGGGGLPVPYTVIVTTTAQGEFQADLHDVIDLIDMSYGEVQWIMPDGHAVTRVFGTTPQSQVDECSARLTSVSVGSNRLWLAMHGCSQYMQVTLRLLDSSAHVKAVQQWLFYPDNYWGTFSTDLYTGTQPIFIAPNDVLEIHTHTQAAPPTPGPTSTPIPTHTPAAHVPQATTGDQWITITVPNLTTRLDPIANVIDGQAPPNTTISLELYRESYIPLRTVTATANAQGIYTTSLIGIDSIISGDRARVVYFSNDSIEFYAMNVLPVLRAPIYGIEVSGWLPPFASFTTTIDSPRVITAVYRGLASDLGSMFAYLPAHAPGDTIIVTTPQLTRRLTLPVLTARIDRATASVYGQAPPNARLKVDLTSHGRSQVITATASGYYTAVFTDLAPLANGRGRLTYFDADGDQAYLEFATQYWYVTLDMPCVSSNAEMANTPITLTLQAATGATKGVFTGTTSYAGGVWACFNAMVQTSDRLTLIYPANLTATFTVPLLSAAHDYAQQAVLGRTIPSTQVEIDLQVSGGWSRRHVWSDANGYYGVDTSDLRPQPGNSGTATITDPDGNLTLRLFTITGYQVFLPVMWRR